MKTLLTQNTRTKDESEKHLLHIEKHKFIHDHPESAPYIEQVIFTFHGKHITADYSDLPEEIIASIRAERRRSRW